MRYQDFVRRGKSGKPDQDITDWGKKKSEALSKTIHISVFSLGLAAGCYVQSID